MKTALGKKNKEVHCFLLNKDLIYCKKVGVVISELNCIMAQIKIVFWNFAGLREKGRFRIRREDRLGGWGVAEY